MYRMYGTQYAGKDVTKYKYMVSLLCPKILVHTKNHILLYREDYVKYPNLQYIKTK